MPEFDIAVNYAYIMNQIYNLAFYSGILPTATLWVVLGLSLLYWIYKRQLLELRSVKQSLSNNLSIEMTEMIEYFVPIFGASFVYFIYVLRGKIGVLEVLPLAIGLVHALLPMQELNECLFRIPDSKANEQRYSDAQKNFDTDYKRENPVTRRLASENLFQKNRLERLLRQSTTFDVPVDESLRSSQV